MAKAPNIQKLSFSELMDLRGKIDRLLIEKQSEEKNALRQRLVDVAKAQGFALEDLLGQDRPAKSPVAVKYRDPKNPGNTWTGRGRMPRWLVAATKGRKVAKDDFLV